MLEVALDSFGLPLNAAEVSCGGLHELQLGTRRGQLRDGLLQLRVGHLVGVELGAVAGQVENLDLCLVLGQPGLHGPEPHAMHEQAVRLQVDPPALAAVVIGTIAVAALLLWSRRRCESLFAWFGIWALLWSLYTAWKLSKAAKKGGTVGLSFLLIRFRDASAPSSFDSHARSRRTSPHGCMEPAALGAPSCHLLR